MKFSLVVLRSFSLLVHLVFVITYTTLIIIIQECECGVYIQYFIQSQWGDKNHVHWYEENELKNIIVRGGVFRKKWYYFGTNAFGLLNHNFSLLLWKWILFFDALFLLIKGFWNNYNFLFELWRHILLLLNHWKTKSSYFNICYKNTILLEMFLY